MNKKTFALSLVLAIFIGSKIGNIYVPDGFESPLKFKLSVSFLSALRFFVTNFEIYFD